jgi:hypothetical protein
MRDITESSATVTPDQIRYAVTNYLQGPVNRFGAHTLTFVVALAAPPSTIASGSTVTFTASANVSLTPPEFPVQDAGLNRKVLLSVETAGKTASLTLSAEQMNGKLSIDYTAPKAIQAGAELRVSVQIEGCAACNVTWVYRAQ